MRRTSKCFLFLEKHLDTVVFELPYGREAVDGASSEAGDGFGDDEVDFAVGRVSDHVFESFTVFRGCPGDAFVSVDFHESPASMLVNITCVVVDLRFVGTNLVIVVSGDTSIPGDPSG